MDFSLYLTLTFTLISILISFSNSTLQTPTIKFCSNKGKCEYKLLSNLTFEFGDPSQNVGVTSEDVDQHFLVCEAPYPVRWLTREYNDGIHHFFDGTSFRKNQEPMGPVVPYFVAYVEIENSSEGNVTAGNIFRCESFTYESLAAEVFIRRPPTVNESGQVAFAGNNKTKTLFVVNRKKDSFVVPCSAKNIPQGKAEDVKLFEGDVASNGGLENRRELSATYDPRIGFKVNGSPNFKKMYECSSSTGSVQLLPLNSDKQEESTLTYDQSDDSLVCSTPSNGSMRGIQLVLAKCDNVTDCDLKFRPTTTLNSLSLVDSTRGIYYGTLEKSDGALKLKLKDIPFENGFVQCSGIFEENDVKNVEKTFTNKIDYLFTGVDGKKHLYNQEDPSSGITKLTELVDENGRVAYNCKLSPFAIYPNNRLFVAEFQDGTNQEIRYNGQYGNSVFKKFHEDFSWEQQVAVNLGRNVKKISCVAPLMSSTDWARGELLVYHSPFTSVGAICGYCGVVAILIVIGVVWFRRSKGSKGQTISGIQ